MKLESLEALFIDQLRDIYNAEQQITKALPKMAKAASTEELRQAFLDHLEETRGQIDRLEQVFSECDLKPRGKKCEAIEGLIEEGAEIIESDASPAVKDAGLIAAGQKVEHYEMASYGCLRTWARLLGFDRSAQLLQETLDEEGEADKKLTGLAEQGVNEEAMTGAE
ncbi:MAG: ferritin-like domain-containing protein [Gemmataceae bacterium]|nr:ferritin-like domain-containing protein [Gemmataceae bacterium]